MNVLTGLNVRGKDPDASFSIGNPIRFTEGQQDGLYRGQGFAARAIDLPASYMVRTGFEVTGDTGSSIFKYMNKNLKVMKRLKEAITWQDVFGGSIIVMTIDDGKEFTDPLDMNNINEVEELNVYDRWRTSHNSTDVQSNSEEKGFGELEFITVNPVRGGTNIQFKVHTSRVLWFNNHLKTLRSFQQNNRWGDSKYTEWHKQLYRSDKAYDAAGKIVDDFITGKYNISGLQDMISSGNVGMIRDRINMMDMSKRVLNSVILDEAEKYEKSSSQISSLPELLMQFDRQLAAVADIPETIFYGTPPKNMGNEEDPSTRKFFDSISTRREEELSEPLEKLVEVVMLSKKGPTKGKLISDDWDVAFPPLWQESDSQQSETRKRNAETDKIYVELGALAPEEVRESRWGGDTYSDETSIDSTRDLVKERDTERKTELEDESRQNEQKLKEINASKTRTDGKGKKKTKEEEDEEDSKKKKGDKTREPLDPPPGSYKGQKAN